MYNETIERALNELLEQFDVGGAVPTIDVVGVTGDIETAHVTLETEEAIENAYAALESNTSEDEADQLDRAEAYALRNSY